MARTTSLLDDVHSEPQQERLASMVNLWYIQRTELNRCGGAVRELASGSKYNTVVCMYICGLSLDSKGTFLPTR